MNTPITRTGKIARLPRSVRDELNRRLFEGERGDRLVGWLNAQPEVRVVLAAEFGGRAINAQNVCDWKRGGYRDWLREQEARALAERWVEEGSEFLPAEGASSLIELVALRLAAHYAVAIQELAAGKAGPEWRWLRELCRDVVALRKGDHQAGRLQLKREQFDFTKGRAARQRDQGQSSPIKAK